MLAAVKATYLSRLCIIRHNKNFMNFRCCIALKMLNIFKKLFLKEVTLVTYV